MISPMRPWWTSAGDREPVEASANRTLTSRARTSRLLTRNVEPCSRTMRRETSSVSESLNAAGALRSLLSTETATSAWLRAGRSVLPEKITSSISDPRMALYEASPITQRTASTRLDLPQPFGSTTPVNPGSITKSGGSTKDLKPIRRSRVSFMRVLCPFPKMRPRRESLRAHALCGAWNRSASARRMNRRESKRNRVAALSRPSPVRAPCRGARGGRPGRPGKGKKPLFFLEIVIYFLGHGFDRQIADQPFAIDEKGRRGIDQKLVHGVVAHRLDVVEHLLIRQAAVEGFLGEAELLGDRLERLDRLLHGPVGLLGKQRFDNRLVFVLAGAARQHEARRGDGVERKFAHHVAHFAGVDVA